MIKNLNASSLTFKNFFNEFVGSDDWSILISQEVQVLLILKFAYLFSLGFFIS